MKHDQQPKVPPEDMSTLIDSAYETPFAEVALKVDALFQELGAKVVRGVSYTGEPATVLFIPREQTATGTEFNNRPA